MTDVATHSPERTRARDSVHRLAHRLLPAALLGMLVLSVPLCAQRTWIVDTNNGPGTDFRFLPQAVTAATDGDRILVRPGTYFGPRTSKALTIVGFVGAALVNTNKDNATKISNLPAGKRFVLAGFVLGGPSYSTAFVEVMDCKGLVVLSGLASAENQQGTSLYIGRSDAVTVHACAFRPGVWTYASRVVISDSIIAPFQHSLVGGFGLRLQEGELDFVASYVQGGDGGGHAPTYPGIWVLGDATLRVRGDASTRIVAGKNYSLYAPSIKAERNKGRLILDPRAALTGAAVEGFASRVVQKQSALSVDYSFISGKSTMKLVGRQGEVGAFWLSIDRAPIDIPGIGSWWLEPSTLVLLGAKVFDSSETLRLVLPHTSDSSLRGLEIGYQGFSLSTGNKLELSNPVLQVLR